jgi:hypothetical protein
MVQLPAAYARHRAPQRRMTIVTTSARDMAPVSRSPAVAVVLLATYPDQTAKSAY